MNNIARGCMTIVVWGAAIGMVSAIAPFITQADLPVVALIALFFAFLTTFLFWGMPEVAKLYTARQGLSEGGSAMPDKVKRQSGDKLALLMELMDDDEREAFKETLKQRALENIGYDDGELPYSSETLASLLGDQQSEDRLRR